MQENRQYLTTNIHCHTLGICTMNAYRSYIIHILNMHLLQPPILIILIVYGISNLVIGNNSNI